MKNKLWKADELLFARMEKESSTECEREFFRQMRHKEEDVLTSSNDLILSERNNEDGLYIVRCGYDEYIVGQRDVVEEQHYMTLSEALKTNLEEAGLVSRDVTLGQWLRERDYAGAEYDHNFDDL